MAQQEKPENLNGRKIGAKLVAAKVLEKRGKRVSVSAAMREVGYSPATAKNPQQLTKSKTWKELLKEFLPDDELARVHREQLEATDVVFRGKKRIEVPDNRARLTAVDMGYKLKGKYAAEKLEIDDPYERMSNGELADKIAKLKAHLLKKRVKK